VDFLVCYDIADDRRRAKVSAALLDYGRRVQESVFLASLDDELKERMRARVRGLLDADEDCVLLIPLCAACRSKAERFGKQVLVADAPYYIL